MFFNFGKKRKEKDSDLLQKIKGYKMQHFDVCKDLWKSKVPSSGQADAVQGELLRQIEKLRNEACDNGNINWDSDFSYFCRFIGETLHKANIFEPEKLSLLQAALNHILECGEYARKFNDGNIAEDAVNPDMIAYTKDDLYDFISDAIAEFALNNPNDIPLQKKAGLCR